MQKMHQLTLAKNPESNDLLFKKKNYQRAPRLSKMSNFLRNDQIYREGYAIFPPSVIKALALSFAIVPGQKL